jgi:beta-glucuronidase
MPRKALFFLIACTIIVNPIRLCAQTFAIFDPGKEDIVDYGKYGEFQNIGTENYKYIIRDTKGLKDAIGEGIFPNTNSVYADPGFKDYMNKGLLKGTQWDFINTDDFQANFYKWSTCMVEPGVKLYYTALALEKSGNYRHAIKAYYDIVVNYPRSVGATYWKTPWYIGPVAIDKIKYITREHPELGIKLVDAFVKVKNRFDDDLKNDIFIVNPGKLINAEPQAFQETKIDLSKLEIVSDTKGDKVRLVRYSNNHSQLLVDGKPYYIRGIAYSPEKIPMCPDHPTKEGIRLDVSKDWTYLDCEYKSWVDKNRNNQRDPDEPAVGDFQLMKDLGVNTIRLYNHYGMNKDLLMDGYKRFGFMYIIGDLIGMYAQGSGADWYSGTDYTNELHEKNMLESVRKMVEEYRNEPYILMWVLGNENNYGGPGIPGKDPGHGTRAKLQPEAYYKFVNKAVQLIKSLDPHRRPVTICNGDTLFLDHCAKNAPDLDIFGCNAYRGEQGFGSLWSDVSEVYGKPVLVTEYGCSAYHHAWTLEKAEEGQAKYLIGNWKDMENNFAGSGYGNSLGGILFEWCDEWWKAGPSTDCSVHDTIPQFGAPFLDGYSYEEWLGITSVGNGYDSPYLRQLRPAYFELEKAWEKYK